MKKLYSKFNDFISVHYKIAFFISCILLAVGSIAIVYSEIKISAVVLFGCSLVASMRVVFYRTGKIPIFMSDTLWSVLSRKYSGEELDEKYKEKCLRSATIHFMLSILGLLIFIICEVFVYFL